MYEAGGCSPGPIYRPHLKFSGTGPHGRGPEYTIPARTFHVSIREKKTQQDSAPGPKYSKPQSVGPQVESMYPSQQIVMFGTAERVTLAAQPTSSGDIGCRPFLCGSLERVLAFLWECGTSAGHSYLGTGTNIACCCWGLRRVPASILWVWDECRTFLFGSGSGA
jgi:hypothetical protein